MATEILLRAKMAVVVNFNRSGAFLLRGVRFLKGGDFNFSYFDKRRARVEDSSRTMVSLNWGLKFSTRRSFHNWAIHYKDVNFL